MKKIITFFLTVIMSISILSPFPCHADTNEVIRVCYFPLEDDTYKYDEHPYHGYYYDYLQEISQHTGWVYEYVDASYEECLTLIENQEIDLVCGIELTEERLAEMDFSAIPILNYKYRFYVPSESDEIYYEDYQNFNNMTVGVLSTSSQLQAIDELCTRQNITIHQKEYSSAKALEHALLTGEVDAIYSIRVSDNNLFRTIAHFDNTPLYFATWQGNDILTELGDAQEIIRSMFPYFEYDLFQENIGALLDPTPHFTRDELAYIKENPDIYFSADPNWEPVEYTNPKTGELEGISAEIIELLEGYTGLNFIYKASNNFTESLSRLNHGEVQILSAFSHDYSWGERNNVNLSSVYLNSYIVMVDNQNHETGKECVALPINFNITSQIVESHEYENIIYFDTTEECIEAVANGDADYTFTNYYIANYHLSNITYRNLTATKISNINENLCLAISKDADPRLLSIINKGLRCISNEKISAIVLEHTLYENEFSIKTILYAYPETIVFIIMLVSTIAVIALLIALILHKRKARKIQSMSETDALTGILNRGAVQAQITFAFEKEKQSKDLVCPLISVDLDNFKAVNDNYGHDEGDLLLKAVARVLSNSVRQTDIVGRMGGDEFIVYLTNVNSKRTAEKVAAKLCTAISALSLEKEEWSEITGSFGLAFGSLNSDWNTLYHQADVALYDAKAKGKNQYSIYTKEMEEAADS